MGRVSKLSAAAQPRSVPSVSSAPTASSSALLGSGNLAGSNEPIQRSTIMGITIGLLSRATKTHRRAAATPAVAREDVFHERNPVRGAMRVPAFLPRKAATTAAPDHPAMAIPAGLAHEVPVVVTLERAASASSSSAASTLYPPPPAYDPKSRTCQ